MKRALAAGVLALIPLGGGVVAASPAAAASAGGCDITGSSAGVTVQSSAPYMGRQPSPWVRGTDGPDIIEATGTCFLVSAYGGSDLIITHPTGAPPVPGYGRYVDGQAGADRFCIANGVPEIMGDPFNPPPTDTGNEGRVDAGDQVSSGFYADSNNCSSSVGGCNISGSSAGVTVGAASPYMGRQPSPWVQGTSANDLIVARGSCFLISGRAGSDRISTYPIGAPPVPGFGRYADGEAGYDFYCMRNGVAEVIGNPYTPPVGDWDAGVMDPTDTVPPDAFVQAENLNCKY